jgi:hypothetical protein
LFAQETQTDTHEANTLSMAFAFGALFSRIPYFIYPVFLSWPAFIIAARFFP